jgi:hypothetical protein
MEHEGAGARVRVAHSRRLSYDSPLVEKGTGFFQKLDTIMVHQG